MNAYREEADRNEILSKLKQRFTSYTMHPQIVDIRERGHAEAPAPLSLSWMYYAGMGDVAFSPLTDSQKKATRTLLQSGQLTYGIPFSHYAGHIYPLRLIEDLNWALDQNNAPVHFQLSNDTSLSPDIVIRPDPLFDPAIEELKKRMLHANARVDAPIRVSTGDTLRPVLLDSDSILLRQRQSEFRP